MKLVMAAITPFTLGQVGTGNTFVPDLQSAAPIRAGKTDAAAI
jgi:nitrogen regulatory protein PII